MKNFDSIKNRIKQYPQIKKFVLFLISSNKHPKPRLWVKLFLNPFFHTKEKGVLISKKSRIDVFPWHGFKLGKNSLIEDFCTINNGAGNVIIGQESRVGIGSVIIGPVLIGNKVGLGQHVFISGFNHGFKDGNKDSNEQELEKKEVVINDESHIGSNSVILAGVHIGRRVQIGAGSVVTKDIPDFSVAVGNPARVIKQYDFKQERWIKIKS